MTAARAEAEPKITPLKWVLTELILRRLKLKDWRPYFYVIVSNEALVPN